MNTEILKVDSTEPDSQSMERAASILAEGGIIGLPTETVYGLAVRVDNSESMRRLAELKSERGEKPYTVHIADIEDLDDLLSEIPESCRKLATKYWPGPLTVVIPDGAGGLGVRMPAHQVAREVIRRSGVHVVCPSANPSGREPATTSDEIIEYFDGRIEMVVDAGPSLLKESSTVVKFENDYEWKVLREGLISSKMIAKTVCRTVIFVCTGNSCRSPMAEYLCRRYLSQALGTDEEHLDERGYRVVSAGTAAFPGGGATGHAIDVLADTGLDLRDHKTQSVTPEMVDDATWIVTMTRRHLESITSLMPNVESKVQMLDPSGLDIEDPVGGTKRDYEECFDSIDSLLKEHLIPQLLGKT